MALFNSNGFIAHYYLWILCHDFYSICNLLKRN